MNKQVRKPSGFTLLEMLLVVAIIAVLAGIAIVAINPGKQLATVRNTERTFNLNEIHKAMQQYYIDHYTYPAATPTTLTEICNTGSNSTSTGIDCTGLIDLSPLVPTYLTSIPVDPQGSTLSFINNFIPKVYATTNGTGYQIMKDSNSKIVLIAPQAELSAFIAIGTTTPASEEDAGTLGDGLIAHYKMNDNLGTAAVVDSIGSYNGTAQQNTSILHATAKTGTGALSFNGTSDYINIAQLGGLSGDTDMTICAWLNTNVVNASPERVAFFYGSYDWYSFISLGINYWDVGRIYAGSYGPQAMSHTGLTDTATWYHICMNKHSAVIDLYLNGVSAGADYLDSFTLTLPSNGLACIGANCIPSAGQFFSGSIDDVRVYSRSLTTDEITAIYNSGAGTEVE